MNQELIELQIKIAYLENTVDELNQVVTSQTLQLTDLQNQLKLIYRYLEQRHDNDDGIMPFDLLNDRPPHY